MTCKKIIFKSICYRNVFAPIKTRAKNTLQRLPHSKYTNIMLYTDFVTWINIF